MNCLYVDSVIKAFAARQVLTDVFLTCEQGEILGLLGRNGTGKSTLLKIIFGSLDADTKFVKVSGQQIGGVRAGLNHIKYLPQGEFLPNDIKVKDFITLFCEQNEKRYLFRHPLVASLLNTRIKNLSGGEKRLIEVIGMIHSSAKFVLLDEPFNGIAPIYRDEIKELIKNQLANKGFIITDHDYRNILDVATRIILIFDGGTKEIHHSEELTEWGYLPDDLHLKKIRVNN